jgi:hypothetical protein
VHVRAGVGDDGDTVKDTVPVNPLIAVTVIAEVPEAPARICVGLTVPALMLKSTTTNVIAAVV